MTLEPEQEHKEAEQSENSTVQPQRSYWSFLWYYNILKICYCLIISYILLKLILETESKVRSLPFRQHKICTLHK